jgi:hypothetical protein
MPGGDPHLTRRPARRARQRLAPTRWTTHPRSGIGVRQWGTDPRLVGVRRCLTRPAREDWQSYANGCGGASTIAAGAVGSERPGLKPRAQSASPLKGAVRRPGARVDRPGAGAVWISRLQPAWGLSPAVHGRAIVDTAALLICAACRARRVGHGACAAPAARRARQRLAPTTWRGPSPVGRRCVTGWCHHARPVGAKRCLTRRPTGRQTTGVRRRSVVISAACRVATRI